MSPQRPKARRTAARKVPSKGRSRGRTTPAREAKSPRFVGREGSPVLDHYPPKDPSLLVRGPPSPSKQAASPPPTVAPPPATSHEAAVSPPGVSALAAPPKMLIALEKPFSVDDFGKLLGETTIRVTVPREDLAEVLRRVSDFMGFGIYVYAFHVRPAASDMLKEFVVELQRVDFSAGKRDWTPFQDRGRSESPFGPDETR